MLTVSHDHRAGCCRVDAKAATLKVRGIASGELSHALGLTESSFDWNSLVPNGRLEVDAPLVERLRQGPVFEHDFDDGRVQLSSGAAGRVTFHSAHRFSARSLLPRSLNLLLAQQWARSGAMPLHAAAFEYAGRGILVLGRRGSGKSTLGMAAVAAGGQLVSDDWVLASGRANQQALVERIRNFVMLREGKTTDQLLSSLPQLSFHPHAQHSRHVLWLGQAPKPLFPASCRIDEIWLLARASRARAEVSTRSLAADAGVLAALIESAMPLLFDARFPHERNALLSTCQHLIHNSSCSVISTGLDLTQAPGQVMDRLIGSGISPPMSSITSTVAVT